jgi:hypothetical protein
MALELHWFDAGNEAAPSPWVRLLPASFGMHGGASMQPFPLSRCRNTENAGAGELNRRTPPLARTNGGKLRCAVSSSTESR